MIPNGTGFFVGVQDEKIKNRSFVYLVTAKHVISNTDGNPFKSIYIRVNKKDLGSEYKEIMLVGEQSVPVLTHKEATVDIAVIPVPFAPELNTLAVKSLDSSLICTVEKYKAANIREGDDVFFVGLFAPFFGAQRNYPVVRFGRVAMITDEKIPWDNQMMDLYLIESQSFGGNSGSPVFFYLGITREPGDLIVGGAKILLAGVMQGTFQVGKDIKVIESRNIPIYFQNIGIAAVVPSYKLYDILFSDELRSIRNRISELNSN